MIETKEIKQSRLKTTTALLGSSAFVAIAVLIPHQAGESNAWRWWCGGFFGLCATVFCWLLIRPQQLKLDPRGFTVTGGLIYSPKKVSWNSIDPFFLYRLPRGGKAIAYNYREGAERPHTPGARLSRRFGADGSLPRLWPGSPDRMVEDLNSYREQALRMTSTLPQSSNS